MKRIDSFPAPALDVRDLRMILALREAGTTKAAGKLLHLAQPSVSRALLSAEERLGVELFHRTPQGLQPTRECEDLAHGAEEILRQWAELEAHAKGPAERVQKVRIVSECHTAYHWLPSAMSALRGAAPSASLSLRIECTDNALEALHDGAVDAALLTSPIRATKDIDVEPLFADELVFVVGRDHPLAKRKRVTPKDLTAHPLFSGRSTPAERRWFMAHVFGRSVPRLDITWVPLTGAIVDLARAGQGIGILTEWVANAHLPSVGDDGGVLVKRFRGKPLKRQWRLAWNRSIRGLGPLLADELRACEEVV